MSKLTKPVADLTLGVLGGGQLGRMLAMETRRMGLRIVSWTGTQDVGPAVLADDAITESFDSATAFATFQRQVDVATVEFENIPKSLLEELENRLPLAPGSRAVSICQHREREKRFLSSNGFPCPHHSIVDSTESLSRALQELPGSHGILKTAEFGYDGKGQQVVHRDAEAEETWSAFDTPRAVLEERVDLAGEVSIMVVRDSDGQVAAYDPAENTHRNHILDLSIIPARLPSEILQEAREIGVAVAEALQYRGILGIEFFLTQDGRLLVNEMAPRPHNSGHHTLDACETSQFEQQARVALGLPIGGTASLTPSVMWNLLGDLWPTPLQAPDWTSILQTPGAKLHLYGKKEARHGRKMGHVTFTAPTQEEALARAQRCREAFSWS